MFPSQLNQLTRRQRIFLIISASLGLLLPLLLLSVFSHKRAYLVSYSKNQPPASLLLKSSADDLRRSGLSPDLTSYHRSSNNYFYVLTSGKLSPGRRYVINNSQANSRDDLVVEASVDHLVPYLKDNRFCRYDSDCDHNSYLCSQSVNNGFYPDVVSGCECGVYDSSLTDTEANSCPKVILNDTCGEITTAAVRYSGFKCQNNRCVGLDREVYCTQ